MSLKNLSNALAFCAIAALCGCSSYSIRVKGGEASVQVPENAQKYQIARIDYSSMAAVPKPGYIDADIIGEKCKTRYPELFADGGTAIDVRVKLGGMNTDNSIGWYFLTLGIAPAAIRVASDYEVSVAIGNVKCPPVSVGSYSEVRISCWSPFGLFQTGKEGYTTKKDGAGIFAAPNPTDEGEVITDLFADAIAEALMKHSDVKPEISNNGSVDRLKVLRDSGVITEREFLELTERAVNNGVSGQ